MQDLIAELANKTSPQRYPRKYPDQLHLCYGKIGIPAVAPPRGIKASPKIHSIYLSQRNRIAKIWPGIPNERATWHGRRLHRRGKLPNR